MAIRIFIFLMLVSFRVACFAQDWSPLGDSLDGYIIGVYNDPITGRLVVNGSFDHIGTLQVDGIASWDGISWSALATGINTSFSPVYSACRFQDFSCPCFQSTLDHESENDFRVVLWWHELSLNPSP